MGNSNVEIFCSLKGQTAKAILINDGDLDVWVPKSLLPDDLRSEVEDMEPGDSFELIIPEWFANQKELI